MRVDIDQRSRTAVLMSRMRWAGVVLGIFQAYLTTPPPVSRTGMLAVTAAMVAYNLAARFGGRLPERYRPALHVAVVACDFAACTAFVALLANDRYSTSYAIYTLVGIEAAVLYRWRGGLTFMAAFMVAMGLVYWERYALFGFPAEIGSLVFRAAIVLMVTVFASANAHLIDRERRALRDSESRTRLLIDNATTAVITADARGQVTGWNDEAVRTFGWDRDEIMGRSLADTIVPVRYRRAHLDGLQRYRASGRARIFGEDLEMTGLHRDGREFPIEISVSPADPSHGGGGFAFVAFVRDITDRKRHEAHQAARLAVTTVLNTATRPDEAMPQLLAAIGESLGWPLGVAWTVDQREQVLRWLAMWSADSLDASEFESVSRDLTYAAGVGLPGRVWAAGGSTGSSDVTTATDSARRAAVVTEGLHGTLAFPILNGSEVTGILEFFTFMSTPVDEELMVALTDLGAQIGQWVERRRIEAALQTEAQARLEAEEKARKALEFRAFHDLLTGLPNRHLFGDRLVQALTLARRRHGACSVMILDLDGFKKVNDTLGHQAGDDILKEVGARILDVIRNSDTAARLGGDEFAILPTGEGEEGSSQIAEKVIEAFARPWTVDGHTISLGVSIGIANYPAHGADAQTLLSRADAAMYQAKRSRSGFAVYSREGPERPATKPVVAG